MIVKKKIGVLTSSRADYGIYKPLLNALSNHDRFQLTIICFGMHLLEKYGQTINEIKRDEFGDIITVEGLLDDDAKAGIVESYGNIVKNFKDIWESNYYDLIFALGDRFEMSAAVQSTIPYQIKIAHIHGGETTLGAIDNIYRHQITLASTYHFPTTDLFGNKISKIIGSCDSVFPVGSISLDKIEEDIPSWKEVAAKFSIPYSRKFVLVTIHPETVNSDDNSKFASIIGESLLSISEDVHVVITMPNADTSASVFRTKFIELKKLASNSFSIVENFGRLNYFAAMKSSEYLLGNTSSGIIEAASFQKMVINVGNRQAGRLRSGNVIDVTFEKKEIVKSHKEIMKNGRFLGENLYHKKGTVSKILNILNEKL
ncbi:UDP-N-acetylglucosamine 2-epimerase [Marinoscillum furvescens]|uniref:GDP/UDP-N,N'-diacetylbacillosamine 2-epimerase (Hydrolysing) n=1 Tax=Marinoscillum furvescens DSM 4134 TaxID=1122208 RepID=A0A3D9L7K3_MARFU|nr:UDP-N-acetylglucosamine 2-epimerase [Marinoscillum furvescens]REE01639.1 GDP/UDP-N,N'-diacetylbacillosamine 2-epimerase (hydrolysing) [Marinoscillum furvescens DSM 4134]